VYKALVGFACVLLSATAAGAQTVYISDDVGVFLHRGPNNQFKLVGTVPAGSRVTLVDRNEMTGYVKIVDGEGKSGWLEKRFVGTEISRRERLASVERELEQLREQFKGSGSKLAAYQSELTQLKHQNQTLDHEVKLRSSEVMRLQNELAGKDQQNQIKWFQIGAVVLAAGIVLGLLAPHLTKRRRRNDGW